MKARLGTPVDLRVQLQLLPSKQSQRTKPLIGGYRGLIRPAGSDLDFAVQVAPQETEIIPGGEGPADVWFLIEAPSLGVGGLFELREGATQIADGRVLGIGDPPRAPR